MYDITDLAKIIKQLGLGANEASKPVNIVFGIVLSVSPLKIQIDQKLILTKEQLILSNNVTNHKTNIKIDDENKTVKVYNGLVKNERVILLRIQGGQKFLIIDKVGD